MTNRSRSLVRGIGLRNVSEHGFSMIEVLVALFVTVFGLLGLIAAQIKAQQTEFESYQKTQAIAFVADMRDRLVANPGAARCYDMSAWPVKYLGPFAGAVVVNCTDFGDTGTRTIANSDLAFWHSTIVGELEK